jgi:hypothetical protein
MDSVAVIERRNLHRQHRSFYERLFPWISLIEAGSAKQAGETEAAKRLRLKDPISYYVKKRPDGTVIPPRSGKSSRSPVPSREWTQLP